MSPLHFHAGRVAARCVVLAVALGVLLPGIGTANQGVYKRGMLSVVWILRFSPDGKVWQASGSGFLVNAREKIVVSNYHVVRDDSKLLLFVPAYRGNELITEPGYYLKNQDKLGLEGKVVARSKSQDLALIRLTTLPGGLHELPLTMRSPKPGQTLHVIGNSGVNDGTLWRYSKGTVREVARLRMKYPAEEGRPAQEVDARLVVTQIPINSGDSGGPVLNERGELAAVVAAGSKSDENLVTRMIDVSELRVLLAKEKLLPKRKTASATRKGRD